MASCSADPLSTLSTPTASLEGLAGQPTNLDADISTGTNASNRVTEPEDCLYRERSLTDRWWPVDSKAMLDMGKDNWPEWRRRITTISNRFGFSHWLDGSLTCLDPSVSPDSHRVWQTNDRTLRTFLLEHISTAYC